VIKPESKDAEASTDDQEDDKKDDSEDDKKADSEDEESKSADKEMSEEEEKKLLKFYEYDGSESYEGGDFILVKEYLVPLNDDNDQK